MCMIIYIWKLFKVKNKFERINTLSEATKVILIKMSEQTFLSPKYIIKAEKKFNSFIIYIIYSEPAYDGSVASFAFFCIKFTIFFFYQLAWKRAPKSPGRLPHTHNRVASIITLWIYYTAL
jgi:hypothetical protein